MKRPFSVMGRQIDGHDCDGDDAASTAVSMMTMNQAARFAACGEGWVIPMVLIKAFAMN